MSVSFFTPSGEVEAVRDVSFTLHEGEVLAIVGESGCGKSVLCKSIMKLLPGTARVKSGRITVNGTDITGYREREMQKLRGNLFSMIFQDPMTSLNPTITIGKQIAEAILVHHRGMTGEQVRRRVVELMELVGIPDPQERSRLYPYNFSGGMRQRCVMAIALASGPRILFADEPTTALDVTIQAQILDLLCDIQKKLGTAAILVSHDLGVVARAADRVAVMYAGKIVEIGRAEEIFYDPRHPYTWGLMRSLPSLAREGEELYTIPGMPPTLIHPPRGDAFAGRNEYALAVDYEEMPPMFRVSDTHYAAPWLLDERAPKVTAPVGRRSGERKAAPAGPAGKGKGKGEGETQETHFHKDHLHIGRRSGEQDDHILEVRHLTHQFRLGKKGMIRAVDDVSFFVRRGEIFGLVGESGSGKSTVARCIMNVYRPTKGNIFYQGVDLCDRKQVRTHRKMLQTTRQIIFQDSTSSLNQRMKVADIIAEPMRIHHMTPRRGSCRAEAEFQMGYVGLNPSYLDKYPPELSGGMRQRVAIARALSMEPELLVADEPIASLDVSIQAQIINLFRHLQMEHGFTFLFIAHDLSVVRYLCDRVGVMYQGKLVEIAPAGELFANPLHPYTKSLLSAIPVPDPCREKARKLQIFDSREMGSGGDLREVSPDHFVLQGDGRESQGNYREAEQ